MPTAGRWLLLLAALGGLLAMHGLSDHGVGGPTGLATAGTHASGAPASGVADPAGGAVHGEHGEPGDGAAGSHERHHDGALVAMCLAVVGAVLLLGAAARRAGLAVRLREALAAQLSVAAATSFWARARGPAPPDLTVLSIQRC